MRTIQRDIRFALRSLRKSPGLAVVAVLSLAFGIGVNTAAFSIINPLLLQPLPYANPNQLVLVAESNTERGYDWFPVAPQNFQFFSQQAELFEEIAALDNWSGALTGSGPAATVGGFRVSTGFFDMLGVRAGQGRTFVSGDDESVIILSDGLWRDHFASDPGIVGKTITIDQTAYTVIGVLPRRFQFMDSGYEAWTPLPRTFADDAFTFHSLQVVARLRPEVSREQAEARLAALMQGLAEEYPKTNKGWSARVRGLQEFFAQEGNLGPSMLAISIAVWFILLMACINVANLLLARAASREKEIAVRAALGARRSRLIRQLLTESIVLGLAGGGLGFLLAYAAMKGVRQILPRIALFQTDALELDWMTALFTLGVSVLTAIFFGLVPALRCSSIELSQSLREGGRGAASGVHSRRFHSALVVCEVALALLVLVGAGLTLNSFVRLRNIKTGFNSQKLLTMRLNLLIYKHRDRKEWPRFFSEVLRELRRTPSVVSAAAIDLLPMRSTSGWFFDFNIQGRPFADGKWPNAASRTVTPGYFATMNIPVLQGREFSEQDTADAPEVVIINDVMAGQFWPDQNPVGQFIKLGSRDPDGKWLEIVGVVHRVRQWSFGTRIFGKEAGEMATVYRPLEQLPMDKMSLVIRTSGDPASMAPSLQQQIWKVDRDQPVTGVRTMDEYIFRAHSGPELNLVIAGIFGLLALLLAVSGIYSVMSYTVSRRSHEMGVRMALGAERGDIFRLVLGQAMKLTGIGLGLGLLAALELTRFMAGMLYEVSPTDVLTLSAVSAFLASIALLASYMPAVRATGFDPLRNLRAE